MSCGCGSECQRHISRLQTSNEECRLKSLFDTWMLGTTCQGWHVGRHVTGQFACWDQTVMVFIRIVPQCVEEHFGECPLGPLIVFARDSLLGEDVSTVTLLADIIDFNRSAFDGNVDPSPVTAPE